MASIFNRYAGVALMLMSAVLTTYSLVSLWA